jgi:hypothetical protein
MTVHFSSPKQFKTELGGCFISHPQKKSSKHKKKVQNGIKGLLHFSSPKVFIYKIGHEFTQMNVAQDLKNLSIPPPQLAG